MSITIGDAILWIRGDTSKLKGDTDKAESQIKGWGQRMGASLKESMNVAMGQLMSQGLTQLSQGLEDLSRDVIKTGSEYAVQVENMARLTGTSAEDSSRMIQVADDMRINYDDLSVAMKTFAKNAEDAGFAETMGVDALAALSDEYLKLAPGVDRANFLLDNFGKSGLSMGKLMEQGGDAIRQMAQDVDSSMVMTDEGIQAARDYEVAMDNWNDAMDGVKLELAQALLPVLKDLASFATTYLVPAIKALVTWFTGLPGPVKAVVITLGALFIGLVQIGPALMGIVGLISSFGPGGALAGVATFIGGTLKAAFMGLAGIIGGITLPVWALIAALAALVAVIVVFGKDAWNNFKSLSDQVSQIIAALKVRIQQEFIEMVASVISTLQRWWQQIVTTATTWATQIKDKFKAVGKAIVDGISSGISGAWEWLKNQVSDKANDLLQAAKDALGISSPSTRFAREIGSPAAEGIEMGFENQIASTAARIGTLAGNLPEVVQMAMVRSSNHNVQIGRVEYHGAFSQSELDYFDRKQTERAERVFTGAWE